MMCDICVMDSVKKRMLSRRDFFKKSSAAALGGAAAAATFGSVSAALAEGRARAIVDMTYTLDGDFPTFSGNVQVSIDPVRDFESSGIRFSNLSISEHSGTHIDAPLHFSADGSSVDEIPVKDLLAPLCVIDITGKAQRSPEAEVTPDDIEGWISRNGDIPDGACIAMHSGWQRHLGTDKYRGFDGTALHYPGFNVEAVKMLIEQTGARSIASDTLSIDRGNSPDFATHFEWLPSGRFAIENLANLSEMPEAGATIFIGAPKHRGGSGGPARIFALM
jgi:kynurenine formamidase